MTERRDIYVPLARSSDMIHAHFSLWLGADHLLSVMNEGYSESYKRFSFKDILAIVVCKTSAGKLWNILFGFLAADFAGLALAGLAFAWSRGAIVTNSAIAAFFLLCLALNSLRGPTCSVYVQTAVQTDCLYALRRFRRAMKVIGQLRPFVEATQGVLTAEEAERRMLEAQALTAAAAPEPAPAVSAAAVHPVRHDTGRAHLVLFAFLLMDLWHSAANFFYQGPIMEYLSLPIMVGTLSAVVLALVRQTRSDLPAGLKNVTWCTLGYVVICFVASIAYGIYQGVIRALHVEAEPTGFLLSPYDSPVVAALLVFSIIGSGTLGLTGLYLLNKFRKSCGQPPPLPQEPEAAASAETPEAGAPADRGSGTS